MKARPITVGPDGSVHVPLARSGEAKAMIDFEDYQYLISLGVSPNWQLCGGSVAAKIKGQSLLIGRILMDTNAGERVRFIDGNPRNLRRSNMAVQHSGWSIRDYKKILSTA